MALRKAAAYSKRRARPFTRVSKAKAQAYIKVKPGDKIAKYATGSQVDYDLGKFNFHLRLIANEKVQVRDNSLEACRMQVTKIMDENAPGQYFFMLKAHPHHILRENKLAAGAGADRLSTGMTAAYGVVVGRAAIVKAGKEVLFVACANDKAARFAREALTMVKAKLPCSCSITFEQIK